MCRVATDAIVDRLMTSTGKQKADIFGVIEKRATDEARTYSFTPVISLKSEKLALKRRESSDFSKSEEHLVIAQAQAAAIAAVGEGVSKLKIDVTKSEKKKAQKKSLRSSVANK